MGVMLTVITVIVKERENADLLRSLSPQMCGEYSSQSVMLDIFYPCACTHTLSGMFACV